MAKNDSIDRLKKRIQDTFLINEDTVEIKKINSVTSPTADTTVRFPDDFSTRSSVLTGGYMLIGQMGSNINYVISYDNFIASLPIPQGGVTQITAGNNITISPSSGKGNVTINTTTLATVSHDSSLLGDGTSTSKLVVADPFNSSVYLVKSLANGNNINVTNNNGVWTIDSTGGTGGMTEVVHDATLSGKGTATVPLSVVSSPLSHDATLIGTGTSTSPLGINSDSYKVKDITAGTGITVSSSAGVYAISSAVTPQQMFDATTDTETIARTLVTSPTTKLAFNVVGGGGGADAHQVHLIIGWNDIQSITTLNSISSFSITATAQMQSPKELVISREDGKRVTIYINSINDNVRLLYEDLFANTFIDQDIAYFQTNKYKLSTNLPSVPGVTFDPDSDAGGYIWITFSSAWYTSCSYRNDGFVNGEIKFYQAVAKDYDVKDVALNIQQALDDLPEEYIRWENATINGLLYFRDTRSTISGETTNVITKVGHTIVGDDNKWTEMVLFTGAFSADTNLDSKGAIVAFNSNRIVLTGNQKNAIAFYDDGDIRLNYRVSYSYKNVSALADTSVITKGNFDTTQFDLSGGKIKYNGGDSGLAAVAHDTTLTGSGTTTDLLRVADPFSHATWVVKSLQQGTNIVITETATGSGIWKIDASGALASVQWGQVGGNINAQTDLFATFYKEGALLAGSGMTITASSATPGPNVTYTFAVKRDDILVNHDNTLVGTGLTSSLLGINAATYKVKDIAAGTGIKVTTASNIVTVVVDDQTAGVIWKNIGGDISQNALINNTFLKTIATDTNFTGTGTTALPIKLANKISGTSTDGKHTWVIDAEAASSTYGISISNDSTGEGKSIMTFTSDTSAPGTVAWGDIGGHLQDQEDLYGYILESTTNPNKKVKKIKNGQNISITVDDDGIATLNASGGITTVYTDTTLQGDGSTQNKLGLKFPLVLPAGAVITIG